MLIYLLFNITVIYMYKRVELRMCVHQQIKEKNLLKNSEKTKKYWWQDLERSCLTPFIQLNHLSC